MHCVSTNNIAVRRRLLPNIILHPCIVYHAPGIVHLAPSLSVYSCPLLRIIIIRINVLCASRYNTNTYHDGNN